jgi:hypothetical protein
MNPKSPEAELCHRAERVWARMAHFGLTFTDLEKFASEPANRARFEKLLQNQILSKSASSSKTLAKSSTSKDPPSCCANGPVQSGDDTSNSQSEAVLRAAESETSTKTTERADV